MCVNVTMIHTACFIRKFHGLKTCNEVESTNDDEGRHGLDDEYNLLKMSHCNTEHKMKHVVESR